MESSQTLKASSIQIDLNPIGRVAIIAAVALAYFLTGKLGLHFATVHPSASAIWAPSGISLAACLLCESWVWPAIFVGAFLVNATTYGSISTSLGIAAGNTLEAIMAACLVRRFASGQNVFSRSAGEVFRFIVLAAVLSTTISATSA